MSISVAEAAVALGHDDQLVSHRRGRRAGDGAIKSATGTSKLTATESLTEAGHDQTFLAAQASAQRTNRWGNTSPSKFYNAEQAAPAGYSTKRRSA